MGRGLVRLSLKNVFMDKKYVNKNVYIRSLHGPLFFASHDITSREIADNVLTSTWGSSQLRHNMLYRHRS